MRHLENGGAPAEVTRAEDPAEENLENLPSIRNLKSRFETKDEPGSDVSERHVSRTGVSDYESPVNGDSRISPSKWDKPKGPPPPVVNRRDDEEEEEAPQTASTRNLVAKFREFERSDVVSPSERKPIRRMTPPRDELSQSIGEAQITAQRADEVHAQQDETASPAYTKNMLAKFKSMETGGPPPSPQQDSMRKATVKTTQLRGQPSKASPDSGISDSEGQQGLVNGDRYRESEELVVEGGVYENEPVVNPDVVKSGERIEEDELPERGFTKSLLAQWRSKEQEIAAKKREEVPLPKKTTRTWETTYSYRGAQRSAGQTSESEQSSPDDAQYHNVGHDQVEGGVYENQPQQPKDVVRETDNNEEEFLPPPAYTRNLLEKFKNIQAEAQRESTSPKGVQKKQYKWTVKEAQTLRGTTPTRELYANSEIRRDSSAEELESDMNGHSYAHSSHSEDQESYHVEDHTAEDELPPPATTKNLLAKFKSLEDVNNPPPSPQRSLQQQKQIGSSSTVSVRRMPNSSQVYAQEREQPEGGEYESQPSEFHQYQVTTDSGEFENAPVHDPNVIRESDRHDEEELPSQGITRNLLAKFQNLQTS
jgi:hypothetical protein